MIMSKVGAILVLNRVQAGHTVLVFRLGSGSGLP